MSFNTDNKNPIITIEEPQHSFYKELEEHKKKEITKKAICTDLNRDTSLSMVIFYLTGNRAINDDPYSKKANNGDIKPSEQLSFVVNEEMDAQYIADMVLDLSGYEYADIYQLDNMFKVQFREF